MGARGNIYVKHSPTSGVYLSTATKGDILPKILQTALVRGRDRWGDTSSLTRIIFEEMTQKSFLGKTGFGISPMLGDNENFILVVDDKNEKIGSFGENGQVFKMFTFAQLLGFTPDQLTWRNLTGYNVHESFGINNNKPDPYPMK